MKGFDLENFRSRSLNTVNSTEKNLNINIVVVTQNVDCCVETNESRYFYFTKQMDMNKIKTR